MGCWPACLSGLLEGQFLSVSPERIPTGPSPSDPLGIGIQTSVLTPSYSDLHWVFLRERGSLYNDTPLFLPVSGRRLEVAPFGPEWKAVQPVEVLYPVSKSL